MILLERLREEDMMLLLQWRRQEHYIKGKLDLQHKDLTMESQRIWFQNIYKNENCIYWMIKSGSIKIGIADINHIDYEEKRCDLECVIGDIHFKNRGIKQDVIYSLYEYAFKKLNMREVCRRIGNDSGNEYDFEKKNINISKTDTISNKYEKNNNIKCTKINDSEWEKIRIEYLIDKIDIC